MNKTREKLIESLRAQLPEDVGALSYNDRKKIEALRDKIDKGFTDDMDAKQFAEIRSEIAAELKNFNEQKELEKTQAKKYMPKEAAPAVEPEPKPVVEASSTEEEENVAEEGNDLEEENDSVDQESDMEVAETSSNPGSSTKNSSRKTIGKLLLKELIPGLGNKKKAKPVAEEPAQQPENKVQQTVAKKEQSAPDEVEQEVEQLDVDSDEFKLSKEFFDAASTNATLTVMKAGKGSPPDTSKETRVVSSKIVGTSTVLDNENSFEFNKYLNAYNARRLHEDKITARQQRTVFGTMMAIGGSMMATGGGFAGFYAAASVPGIGQMLLVGAATMWAAKYINRNIKRKTEYARNKRLVGRVKDGLEEKRANTVKENLEARGIKTESGFARSVKKMFGKDIDTVSKKEYARLAQEELERISTYAPQDAHEAKLAAKEAMDEAEAEDLKDELEEKKEQEAKAAQIGAKKDIEEKILIEIKPSNEDKIKHNKASDVFIADQKVNEDAIAALEQDMSAPDAEQKLAEQLEIREQMRDRYNVLADERPWIMGESKRYEEAPDEPAVDAVAQPGLDQKNQGPDTSNEAVVNYDKAVGVYYGNDIKEVMLGVEDKYNKNAMRRRKAESIVTDKKMIATLTMATLVTFELIKPALMVTLPAYGVALLGIALLAGRGSKLAGGKGLIPSKMFNDTVGQIPGCKDLYKALPLLVGQGGEPKPLPQASILHEMHGQIVKLDKDEVHTALREPDKISWHGFGKTKPVTPKA